jgi:hypothetical protein
MRADAHHRRTAIRAGYAWTQHARRERARRGRRRPQDEQHEQQRKSWRVNEAVGGRAAAHGLHHDFVGDVDTAVHMWILGLHTPLLRLLSCPPTTTGNPTYTILTTALQTRWYLCIGLIRLHIERVKNARPTRSVFRQLSRYAKRHQNDRYHAANYRYGNKHRAFRVHAVPTRASLSSRARRPNKDSKCPSTDPHQAQRIAAAKTTKPARAAVLVWRDTAPLPEVVEVEDVGCEPEDVELDPGGLVIIDVLF